MGAVRSMPDSHIETVFLYHSNHYIVTVSVCGWQFFMQDFALSLTSEKYQLYAIIDGHNGPQIAQFCQRHLKELYQKNEQIKKGQVFTGLENLIYELEELAFNSHSEINDLRAKNNLPALAETEFSKAGCSIILVCVQEEEIIIGNVGLCRCYATYKSQKEKAILCAGNHITSNKEEQERVLKSGGFIYNNKVNGSYPFTRSIGDYHMKKNTDGKYKKDKTLLNSGLISSQPSIKSLRKQDIASIMLGSSGVWEQPEKIGKVMAQLGKSREEDQEMLENLIGKMIATEPTQQKCGLQNMTIMYINFTN